MKRVVVTEKIHPDGPAILKSRTDIEVVQLTDCEPDTLKRELANAHGVLVRSAFLNSDILAGATELQVVSRHGVGCDHIDVDHLTARRIPVAIAASANARSVAEHVIMMMMVLTKAPFVYDRATREGRFHERGSHYTTELFDKTILVVGYGRIGSLVAPMCKAFGMRVMVADIALNEALAREQGVEGIADFRGALAQADFLTVHVPLNPQTHHLIGAPELAALPDHAIVINCARGGIIDEAALAAAVSGGTIAGTGADVFSTEPPAPDNPLLSLPNSIYSPHSAAVTQEGARNMSVEAAQNIVDAFDGKLRSDYIFNADQLKAEN
ncbi:MAG: hydroxyacid dehydrogenase [Burkholderiaceae bacterium]